MVYCVQLPIAYNCNRCQKMWWFYDYQLWLSIQTSSNPWFLPQRYNMVLTKIAVPPAQLSVVGDLWPILWVPKKSRVSQYHNPTKWVIWVHNFVKFNCWPLKIAWQVAHLPACRPFLSTAATSLHHNQSTHSHSTTMAPSNIWQSILHFTSSLAKYGTYTWRPHTISDPSTSETTSEEQAIYAQCPSVSLLSASNQSLLDRLPAFAL